MKNSGKGIHVLVTGAAGYLGAVMVPHLLEEGYQVTALDNFMFKQTSLLSNCPHPNFSVVRGDVRDRGLMKTLLREADVIIPLACLTGAPLCAQQPEAARSIIVDAIEMMLDLRSDAQRILYPTTNSGYGIGEEGLECTEESPLRPISLYGRLKCEAEDRILNAGNSLTYRLATVFGTSPRMRLDLLVNDFTWRAVKDGFLVLFEAHFKRNYIHIQDIARVFLQGIEKFDDMQGRTYNVGLSSANLSKYELCLEIQKLIPNFYFTEAAVGKDPDQRNYIVSNERIEATGFRPEKSIADGIRELIKAYTFLRLDTYSNV